MLTEDVVGDRSLSSLAGAATIDHDAPTHRSNPNRKASVRLQVLGEPAPRDRPTNCADESVRSSSTARPTELMPGAIGLDSVLSAEIDARAEPVA